MGEEAMSPDYQCPFGKVKVEREGADVSIVTFSRMVGSALEVAAKAEALGISVEVINLRSIRPLDRDGIIATVEEGWPQHGVGAEIAAMMMESEAFDYLDAPVERIAGADIPMPYSHAIEQ